MLSMPVTWYLPCEREIGGRDCRPENSGRLSTLGMEAAVSSIHSGNSENEVAGAAAQQLSQRREYFAIEPIVRAGRRSA